jgi:hypothetical protein
MGGAKHFIKPCTMPRGNGIVLSVTGAVNLPELITELGRIR